MNERILKEWGTTKDPVRLLFELTRDGKISLHTFEGLVDDLCCDAVSDYVDRLDG